MHEAEISRVATLFDALSDSYDNTGVDFFRPIARGLVHALKPTPGEQWLDIGCGKGAVIEAALPQLMPAGGVTGIDISPRMVDMTAAAFAGDPHVEVLVDDAQNPSDGLGHFDVIASSLVLFFLPDPAAALRSWQPRLRHNGRIGVTTFGARDARWEHVDSVFQPYLPPSMKDARTSGTAGPFASDSGMEDLLIANGYEQVRTVVEDIVVRFEDRAAWEAFTWSVGQRAMWLAIPEADRSVVRDEAFAILANYADAHGVLEFQQLVRHTLGIWTG